MAGFRPSTHSTPLFGEHHHIAELEMPVHVPAHQPEIPEALPHPSHHGRSNISEAAQQASYSPTVHGTGCAARMEWKNCELSSHARSRSAGVWVSACSSSSRA